jgi:hypothetical protein
MLNLTNCAALSDIFHVEVPDREGLVDQILKKSCSLQLGMKILSDCVRITADKNYFVILEPGKREKH